MKYSIIYCSWVYTFFHCKTTCKLLTNKPNLASIIDILRCFMSNKQENVPYSYLNKMAFWFMVMTRRFEGSINMSSSIIIPSNPDSFIFKPLNICLHPRMYFSQEIHKKIPCITWMTSENKLWNFFHKI